MDGQQFDAFARMFAARSSRRRLVLGLVGAWLGGTFVQDGTHQVAAACPRGAVRCRDGTCADLRTDPANCGRCHRACDVGQVCHAGRCRDASSCPSGFAACGDTCVRSCPGDHVLNDACLCACPPGLTLCNSVCRDVLTDVQHCGDCGHACVAGPNVAAVACASGDCLLTQCMPGFTSCDGVFDTGCETPLNTATDCAGCGHACPAPANATATCSAGQCGFQCDVGFRRCGNECIPDASGSCCDVTECPAPEAGTCQVAACEGHVCGYIPAPAGTVCREAAGDCDVAEVCDGISTACPPDVVIASGTVCRAARDLCELPATCTGDSSVCPENPLAGSDVVCRPSTGPCDPAETCTGNSAQCPPDNRLGDGEACGADQICCNSVCCPPPAANEMTTCDGVSCGVACRPLTCHDVGICGTIDDGCGGTIECTFREDCEVDGATGGCCGDECCSSACICIGGFDGEQFGLFCSGRVLQPDPCQDDADCPVRGSACLDWTRDVCEPFDPGGATCVPTTDPNPTCNSCNCGFLICCQGRCVERTDRVCRHLPCATTNDCPSGSFCQIDSNNPEGRCIETCGAL